jgi:hypothetical protein
MSNDVNHPSHYNRGQIEVIQAIRAYTPDFSSGSALKYLCRAGSKPGADVVTDLQKAAWYVKDAVREAVTHPEDRYHSVTRSKTTEPEFSVCEFLDDQGLTGKRRQAAALLMRASVVREDEDRRRVFLEVAYDYVLKAIEEASVQRTEAAEAAAAQG